MGKKDSRNTGGGRRNKAGQKGYGAGQTAHRISARLVHRVSLTLFAFFLFLVFLSKRGKINVSKEVFTTFNLAMLAAFVGVLESGGYKKIIKIGTFIAMTVLVLAFIFV